MKRAEKKEHLIKIAVDLFNRSGYHATGIDQIIGEAGIAKTTLYRHFESKEALIVAALRRIDERYREDMRRWVDENSNKTEPRLLMSFDFLANWFSQKNFYGCPFINAAAEYSERSSPVFGEALMHKRLLVAYFDELARADHMAESTSLAEQINLLHEGAIAVAHVTGQATPARQARSMASALIQQSQRTVG